MVVRCWPSMMAKGAYEVDVLGAAGPHNVQPQLAALLGVPRVHPLEHGDDELHATLAEQLQEQLLLGLH